MKEHLFIETDFGTIEIEFSNRNLKTANLKTSTFLTHFIKPSLQAKTTYNEEFNKIYLIYED